MMMSKCFIGFLISDLGEPNIYQNLVCFTRMWEDCGGWLTVKNYRAHMQKYGFEENLTNYCKT